jgi:hypothetical protein
MKMTLVKYRLEVADNALVDGHSASFLRYSVDYYSHQLVKKDKSLDELDVSKR